MLKMADKTIAFVQKTLDYAQLNFAFVPAFLDLKEFGKPRPYIAQTYTNPEIAPGSSVGKMRGGRRAGPVAGRVGAARRVAGPG